MKLKFWLPILYISLVMLISSCPMSGKAKKTLSISFEGNLTPNRSRVTLDDLTPFDRSIYSIPYSNNTQGSLVGEFTPHSLIVPIVELSISHPNFGLPLIMTTGMDGGPPALVHIDVAKANDIFNPDIMTNAGELSSFTALHITFFADSMSDAGSWDFPIIQEIHIDLGDIYKDVTFASEIPEKKNGSIHVFHLKDLIPLNGQKSVVRLQFDDHISTPMIVNPDGSYVEDFNPDFWDAGGRIGMAGPIIYRPGRHFTLSEGPNRIKLIWNLNNLIQVYDNNTPTDYSDDLITLRLDDPFPISIVMEQATDETTYIEDGYSPDEVQHLDVRYSEEDYPRVVLRWVNPSNPDLRRVSVVRKEHEIPSDINDGETVHSSRFPVASDTTIKQGTYYYYKVFAYDTEGLISEGVSIGVDTTIERIDYSINPDPASIGDDIYMTSMGYARDGIQKISISPDITLTGDSLQLINTSGNLTILKAIKAGNTVIRISQAGKEYEQTITVSP